MRFIPPLFAFLLVTGACSDDGTMVPVEPGPAPDTIETAVIVNSTDVSVTIFDVEAANVTQTIGLNPGGAGSPVSVAARKNLAVVPLGFFAAAAVVNLATGAVNSVPLPDNSGATGVDFINDSIAYVANPNLNTVSEINAMRATAGAEITVGIFPQAVLGSGDLVFVLNAQLDENFAPAREGTVTLIDATSNTVLDSITLSGFNPSAAIFGGDGRLYVLNSGSFGQGDGSLSVIDLGTLEEVEHHEGFGEFPGDIAWGPDDLIYVSAFAYGIAVWDPDDDVFINSPDDPLVVQGNAISSGLGIDAEERLYTLIPGDCVAPSIAIRLNADLSFDREIIAGGCPFAIAFSEVVLIR